MSAQHQTVCFIDSRSAHHDFLGVDPLRSGLAAVVGIVREQDDAHLGQAARVPGCRRPDGAVVAVVGRLAIQLLNKRLPVVSSAWRVGA